MNKETQGDPQIVCPVGMVCKGDSGEESMRLLNVMEGAVGHYESISRGPEYTGAMQGHGGFQRDLRRAEELAVVSEWGGEAQREGVPWPGPGLS